MVTQYPHTATATINSDAITLPNGDIQPGTTTTVSFKCRVEPSTGYGTVKTQDGTALDYAWKVYGKNIPVLAFGTDVEIKDNQGRIVCKDTVKQFSKGQLNTRLWL